MSKVKINANYPENPGLVEGKYWLFYDRGFDFMDDPNMFPAKAQLKSDPSSLGLSSWEDIATKLRAARDQWLKMSNELSFVHLQKWRLTGDAYPKAYSNQIIDLAPSSDTAPEHEKTRFVFPSMVDGSNNFPDLVIEGAEMYAWNNSEMPRKGIKVLKKRGNYSMEYLLNSMDYTTGGDGGTQNYHLPEEFALANPFAEYSWYANSVMNQWLTNLFGEDGTSSITSYQDIHTFLRACKDQVLRDANDIYIMRSNFSEAKILDGTVAANYGMSQADFEAQYYNLERYSAVKAFLQGYTLPDVNPYRCTLNGVENQGFKDAFATSYLNTNIFITRGLEVTTPFEVFGNIDLDYLPAVKYVAELKGVTAQLGDVIIVEEIGQRMAFDGTNWTEDRFGLYEDCGLTTNNAITDAKDKAFNELLLSIKPFVWSSHHVPAYTIMENNEIRTESDRTVLNFSTFNV